MMKKHLLYPLLFITGLAFAGTSVTWNGSSYTVPSVGEENWFGSDKVDGLLISLANNGFQKSGGAFTLTGEVDFGGSAGLTGLYFGTRSSNDSTSGVFRLSNAESIGWRNAANSGNLLLSVDSSNTLTFNGNPVVDPSGITPVTAGGTGFGSYTSGDLLYASGTAALSKLGIGTASYVLKSTGSAPSWGQIVNASVDNSAAIARSKLASGTANHVVINDATGAFSSESLLAVSRGGTGLGSYTAGDLLYASATTGISKLAVGSTGQVLSVSGGLPAWSNGQIKAVSDATGSTFTASATVDTYLLSRASATQTVTLPEATGSGKTFTFKKTSTHFDTASNITIQRATDDTITDSGSSGTSTTMNTQGERIEITDVASNTWQVIDRRVPSITTSYTPSFAGLGTVSSSTCFWARRGDSLRVHCHIVTGTHTAALATVSLPSGLDIDSGKLKANNNGNPGQNVGKYAQNASANQVGHVITAPGSSTTTVYFGDIDSGTGKLVPQLGNSILSNTSDLSFYFDVPISGWNG